MVHNFESFPGFSPFLMNSYLLFFLFQEIVNFAKSKQIPVDNSKRESIAYGLKKLRQKIRGREDLDHQVAALDKQDSLLSQYLQSFADQDLDFIYDMPLNSEYLSLLETFPNH